MLLGGCASACVIFFLPRCASGVGNWDCVRSLCRWAVAWTFAWNFPCLAVLGAAASGRKLRLRSLRSLAVPLGGGANACVSFFLPRCARGSCKRLETAIAWGYVRSLCPCAVARKRAWIFSWFAVLGAAASGQNLRSRESTCWLGKARGIAHSHLDTCTCLPALVCLTCTWTFTLGYLHLLIHTWILTFGHLQVDTC